jgi:hypothetical protein
MISFPVSSILIIMQKSGTASYNKIPLASNLFKKAQAIKSSKSATPVAKVQAEPSATHIPTPPVTSAPFPQYAPFFNPFMFNPMTPYAMGMPGVGMPGVGMPGTGMPGAGMLGMGMQGYNMSGPGYMTRSPHKERSSSPIEISGNIHTFCQAYGIDNNDEHDLERLGFVLGGNLDEVTEQEYKDVGFKPLAWKRVLKAYKKYKHNAKA